MFSAYSRRSLLLFLYNFNTCLRQLEDVLLAVHNLQRPLRCPAANVAGVQPPVRVQRLRRLLRHFVVATEHVGAFDAHLAGPIVREVVQLSDIHQLDGTARGGNAHMPGKRIALDGDLSYSFVDNNSSFTKKLIYSYKNHAAHN